VTVRLPSLVFRTAHQQGGTYHLTYTQEQGSPDDPASLHVVVLYPDTGLPVVYDYAETEGGCELPVDPITHDCADGYHTERFRVRLPDEVLTERVASGARIKIGRTPGDEQLILDLPRAHLEALLALRFPHGAPPAPAVVENAVELDISPFDSDRNSQNELEVVEPTVRDAPFRTTASAARTGPWVILGALALLIIVIVWQFVLRGASRPAAQPAQTAPVEVTPRGPVTTPSVSSSRAVEPLPADPLGGVRGFVEAWFAGVSGRDDMAEAMSFYAPRVDYYQRGVVAKSVVLSDKAQALRRWPVQNNQIEGEITVTQGSDETRATFLFSYWLENGRQIRNGRARVLLALQERDGRYYIVRENTIALDAAGNATNAEFYWRHGSSN
jgi:hypothetical protein